MLQKATPSGPMSTGAGAIVFTSMRRLWNPTDLVAFAFEQAPNKMFLRGFCLHVFASLWPTPMAES